jgi:hypothetical protein
LCSSFTIKFCKILCITNYHYIKYTIICCTYSLWLFFPYLKNFSALTIHNLTWSISILTKYIHISVNEIKFLNVVSRTKTDSMKNFIFVGVNNNYLVWATCYKFMAKFRISNRLAIFKRKLNIIWFKTLWTDCK